MCMLFFYLYSQPFYYCIYWILFHLKVTFPDSFFSKEQHNFNIRDSSAINCLVSDLFCFVEGGLTQLSCGLGTLHFQLGVVQTGSCLPRGGSSTLCCHCFERNRLPIALRNYASIIG